MPYSGPDDKDLPPGVKKLSDHQRKVWVKVFNSVHAQHPKDESYAFATAYAAAQGGKARITPHPPKRPQRERDVENPVVSSSLPSIESLLHPERLKP